jgi:hypothetical protein
MDKRLCFKLVDELNLKPPALLAREAPCPIRLRETEHTGQLAFHFDGSVEGPERGRLPFTSMVRLKARSVVGSLTAKARRLPSEPSATDAEVSCNKRRRDSVIIGFSVPGLG